jgi:hypothetical protein
MAATAVGDNRDLRPHKKHRCQTGNALPATLGNVLSAPEFHTIVANFNFLIFLAASEVAHDPRLRHREILAVNQ